MADTPPAAPKPTTITSTSLSQLVSFCFVAISIFLFSDRSKRCSCEACEKSTSGGVLFGYVEARRSSATKQMCLFQRSVTAAPPASQAYTEHCVPNSRGCSGFCRQRHSDRRFLTSCL